MTKTDQVIQIVFTLVIAFICFQVGIMLGGERERAKPIETISPEKAEAIEKDVSLTEAFISMVNVNCREEKHLLELDKKVLEQRIFEYKEKESNDDGNNKSKCDCSLCF